MRVSFASPSTEHRPLAAWHWPETPLSEKAIRQTLRRTAEAGFGGIVVDNPPASLSLETLPLIAKEMAHLELGLWLQFSPNDFAVESCSLFFRTAEAMPSGVLGAYRNVVNAVMPHTPLAATVVPLRGEQGTLAWPEALSFASPASPDTAALDSMAGRARMWMFAVERKPQAGLWSTGLFGRLWQRIEELRRALGPEHVHVLRGISIENVQGEFAFPWADDFALTFQKQHGYDLLPTIHSLVTDTGATAARVRQHFWETAAALARERFWQPLLDGCHDQQMELRAVIEEECSPARLAAGLGDAAGVLRSVAGVGLRHRLPTGKGVPPVGNDGAEQVSSIPTRLAYSLAVLDGDRNSVTSFGTGIAGAPTPQELLRVVNERVVQGVTSSASYAVSAFPAESVLSQPFSAHLAQFNDYCGRCGTLAAQGRSGARVALLWPQRSFRTHFNPRGHRLVRWVEEDLRSTINLLEELHFDFLLVPEEDLATGTIRAGDEAEACKLCCGESLHAFEMVVLSSVTALSRKAWENLQKFVAEGGKVVCLGLLPRWTELGRDEEWEDVIGKATMLVVEDLYDAYTEAEGSGLVIEDSPSIIGFPIVRSNTVGGRLCCYQPRLNADQDDARLRVRQMLMESLSPELESQTTGILSIRRLCEGGELLGVWNREVKAQQVNLRIRPEQRASAFECDTWTGETVPLAVWMPLSDLEGGGLGFSFDLAAGELRWYWFDYKETPPHCERANIYVVQVEEGVVRGYATQSGTPMVARRDHEQFRQLHGEDVRLPSPLLLPEEWIGRRLGPNSLVVGDGVFSVKDEGVSLWLVTLDSQESVKLDGQVLVGSGAPPYCDPPHPDAPIWYDDRWQWYTLPSLTGGEHRIELTAPQRAFLVGEFAQSWDGSIAAPQEYLLSEGSWHEQGLRYYCGVLEMTQAVMISDEWKGCNVFLEFSFMRDTVSLNFNGQPGETRVAAPYRFDVTPYIRPGELNEIQLRIENTTSALWAIEPKPSGILGPVRLVAYPLVEIVG
jgi:hypothetical protein